MLNRLTPARKALWIEGGYLLLLALLLAPVLTTTYWEPDELNHLYDAWRMTSGQVIYRDFFASLPPLSTALAAGVFAIAGKSLFAARVLLVALMVGSGACLFRIARLLDVPALGATLPGLGLVLALFYRYPAYYHHWPALCFALCALWAAMSALEGGRPGRWAAAGGLAALTLLCTQSQGLVTLAVVASAPVLAVAAGRASLREAGRALGGVALGATLPLALTAGLLAWQGALGAAWAEGWVWPLAHYRTAGGTNDVAIATDLPGLLNPFQPGWISLKYWYVRLAHAALLYAVVALTPLAAVAWALGLARRRTRLSLTEARQALAGLLACGFFAACLRGKSDLVHVAMTAAPSLLVAASGAAAFWRLASAPALIAVRALPFAGLALLAVSGGWLQAEAMRRSPATWLVLATPDSRLVETPSIRYLQTHTPPGGRILSMPAGGFHYFFSGLAPASVHTLMVPKRLRYFTADEHAEFAKEVTANAPAYIVLTSELDEEAAKSVYFDPPIPGYTHETTLKIGMWGGLLFDHVYRRTAP